MQKPNYDFCLVHDNKSPKHFCLQIGLRAKYFFFSVDETRNFLDETWNFLHKTN